MIKFEVGDTVKVVKLDCKWNNWLNDLAKYIGKTGKIKPYLSSTWGETVYSVQFEDDWWYFPEDWLELVEKAKTGCNGQVFIVDADNSVEIETGKVYNVKNGYLMIEKDHYNPLQFHSMKELLGWLSGPHSPHIQAIEFKGFSDQE